jgi:hypothetical protein
MRRFIHIFQKDGFKIFAIFDCSQVDESKKSKIIIVLSILIFTFLAKIIANIIPKTNQKQATHTHTKEKLKTSFSLFLIGFRNNFLL